MEPPDYGPALETLLASNRQALVAMIGRRIPRQLAAIASAEDLAQEVSLEAIRSVGEFRPREDDSLRRWVCRIARHRVCDLIKSQRRLKRAACVATGARAEDGDPAPLDNVAGSAACPAGAAARVEDVAAVRGALLSLPDAYRRAVEMRYLEGLSVAETAARLGRTPRAVQMLCNRGVKRLRRELAPDGANTARRGRTSQT